MFGHNGDKLVEITWRKDQPGMSYGVTDQKRGDVQKLPKAEAEKVVFNGLADFGRIPLEYLRPAHVLSEADIKGQQRLAKQAAEQAKAAQPDTRVYPSVALGRADYAANEARADRLAAIVDRRRHG